MPWCTPVISCEIRRDVCLPLTLLFKPMPLTLDLFLTAANMVYSQVLTLFSRTPRRHVVISLKSMQSSRFYFIIDTSLLIMASVSINFYKGFSSYLRHLDGSRKLPGDLERVTWSNTKEVIILMMIIIIKSIFPPVNRSCILQRTSGFKGSQCSVFTTVLWDRMNVKK